MPKLNGTVTAGQMPMPDLTLPAAADAHKLFKIETVSMAMDEEAANLDQDSTAVVTAQGHEGLLTHFQPALEPPSFFPKIPGLSPMRWMVAREYPECFLAVKQDGKLFSEMFYCAGCRCWKKISSTFHHVRAHYSSSIHNLDPERSKFTVSPAKNQQIRTSLVHLFAVQGLSFSTIDSPDLQSLCSGLPHRKSLSRIIKKMGEMITDKVRCLLSGSKRVTISFDEWTDRVNRRFLGINSTTWLNGGLQKFCLRVENLDCVMQDSDHVNGGMISQIVCGCLEDYNISDKVFIMVTDRGSSMTTASQVICQSIGRRIIHGNCLCHLVNSMLSRLIREFKPLFQEVFDMRARLSTLTFSHYLRKRHRRHTVIPSYSEVRWYSLFQCLKVLDILKPDIIDYYAENSLGVLNLPLFDSIQRFRNLTKGFKTITQYLERDEFGVIGLALWSLESLKTMVANLADWKPDAKPVLESWNSYFNEVLSATKRNWEGVLQVAALLHPGVLHQEILTQEELQIAIAAVRTGMTFYGYHQEAVEDEPVTHNDKTSAEQAVLELLDTHRSNSVVDELGVFLNRKRKGTLALSFWSSQTDLPYLTKVAHDFLAIVPSSAGTERTFSCSGRIEGLRRARLADKTLEASVQVAMSPEDLISPQEIQELIIEGNRTGT